MNPVSVTCRRTLSRARNLYTTAFALGGFLAACAVSFAFRFAEAEGSRQVLSAVWALSVAPILPILSAFLSADAMSEERQSGRMDVLLSTAVRERDYVLGKALGVWIALAAATFLSLVSTCAVLAALAPNALEGVRLVSFAPAFLVLCLQNALWATASIAVSAACVRPFAAVASSLILLVGLPRGLWVAAMLWAPSGRSAFGTMPLDAMVEDFSAGFISSAPILVLLILAPLFLFLASKTLLFGRFAGRGSSRRRFSSAVAMLLSVSCAVAVSMLAVRLDTPLDLQIGVGSGVSSRMRTLFADATGRVTVTAFLSRKSPSFRSVARYLRALKRQADVSGGLAITLRFVDPAWDLGEAGRLVRLGAKENSLVFEKGRRFATLGLDGGYGDRTVGAALRSIVMPPQHRDIYWTTGHGELKLDAYGPWGMSDIARELVRNGYRNMTIDLTADRTIPADCALIAIAGAHEAFSRAELSRLDAYLRGGGRLLVLMGPSEEGGVASLLPAWGIRPLATPLAGARTLSGTDVIVSGYADHVVASGMDDSRIVLEKPLTFISSAVTESGTGVDRVAFTPVAVVGTAGVVAAVERGGSAGNDLAVRPTRIVVIGDEMFVANGQLAARGNANADFFLNAVAYLSGSEVSGGSATESGVVVSGLDRASRVRFVLISALVPSALVILLLMFIVLRRRNRR